MALGLKALRVIAVNKAIIIIENIIIHNRLLVRTIVNLVIAHCKPYNTCHAAALVQGITNDSFLLTIINN